MATFSEMCPGIAPAANNTDGACPNLTNIASYRVWTAYPITYNHTSFFLSISSGEISATGRVNASTMNALCK